MRKITEKLGRPMVDPDAKPGSVRVIEPDAGEEVTHFADQFRISDSV